jgi:tetratricopeptide (TPR) repeat protein
MSLSPHARVTLGAVAASLALCLAPRAAHAGLFQANHPKVAEGNAAYGKGEWDRAREAYESAAQELPRSAEVQYNLGDVYLKMGRTDDAKRAFEAALAGADAQLKTRGYFNLGNAFAALNDPANAMAAYRQALKVDPGFEPARHNLEVLLRKKDPPQDRPQQGDGGTPDGGSSPDGGKPNEPPDGGSADSGAPDAGGADGGADDGDAGGRSDGGESQDGGGEGQGTQGSSADGGTSALDGGTPSQSQSAPQEQPKQIDRQEAERLLDAVRRNEKQFLMQQHQEKGKRRARPDKDW